MTDQFTNETAMPGPEESPSPVVNKMTDGEALEVLAEPESPEAYIEERKDIEKAEQAEEAGEDTDRSRRKVSRYERLKRARDAVIAENAELRRRMGLEPERREPEAPPPSHDDQQQYEQQQHGDAPQFTPAEYQGMGAFNARANELARADPDFDRVVEEWMPVIQETGGLPLGTAKLLIGSDYGPQIVRDILKSPDPMAAIEELRSMPPVVVARWIGRMETKIDLEMRPTSQQRPAPRVTRAPAPLRPPSGGAAGPSRDLSSLAKSDSIDDYVRARQRERS